jgi:ATP-dependent Clp protease ATP-binding subunit ClpA
MFERFTERARQVVVFAQDEAVTLRHNYIGTEHILLGLMREEEGLAARALESLEVTLEEVRAQVARIVGQGDEVTMGQIPFTPRSKRVLELALREALALGHNYIGTEHVLLGLARENEGVAMRILLDFDVDAEKIRNEILRMLSGSGRVVEAPFAPPTDADLEEARAAKPELAAELDDVVAEKEAAIQAREFERAAALRDKERRLLAWLLGRPEPRPRPLVSTRPLMVTSSAKRVVEMPGWRRLWAAAATTALASAGVGLVVGWLIWG